MTAINNSYWNGTITSDGETVDYIKNVVGIWVVTVDGAFGGGTLTMNFWKGDSPSIKWPVRSSSGSEFSLISNGFEYLQEFTQVNVSFTLTGATAPNINFRIFKAELNHS